MLFTVYLLKAQTRACRLQLIHYTEAMLPGKIRQVSSVQADIEYAYIEKITDFKNHYKPVKEYKEWQT